MALILLDHFFLSKLFIFLYKRLQIQEISPLILSIKKQSPKNRELFLKNFLIKPAEEATKYL